MTPSGWPAGYAQSPIPPARIRPDYLTGSPPERDGEPNVVHVVAEYGEMPAAALALARVTAV